MTGKNCGRIFFLRLPDLRHKIERYRIHSLMELEYRAAEYFMDTD